MTHSLLWLLAFGCSIAACLYYASQSRRHAERAAESLREAKDAIAKWWEEKEDGR